jgi:hypothetical protein
MTTTKLVVFSRSKRAAGKAWSLVKRQWPEAALVNATNPFLLLEDPSSCDDISFV